MCNCGLLCEAQWSSPDSDALGLVCLFVVGHESLMSESLQGACYLLVDEFDSLVVYL